MIKIALVEDLEIVRKGIVSILNEEQKFEVVYDVGEGKKFLLEFNRKERPIWDVVIIDISLPDITGMELLTQIRHFNKNMPILMLSIYPASEYGVRCINAGASGYLHKSKAVKDLVDAITAIYEGKRWISQEFALNMLENKGCPKHQSLSDREFEVFRLYGQCLKNKEIAQKLCLSPKTISTYKTRIFEKLGIHSDGEMVRYWVKLGL